MTDQEAPSLSDILNTAIRYNLSNVHTSFPGKVLEYSAGNQKANIQPLIKKVYMDKRVESYPVLTNVPVVFPRTANSIISLPIKKGDLVLVIITERSIDQWLEKTGEESEPVSNRRFDLSDAVAIPGLYPFGSSSDADADSILIKNGQTKIKMDDDGKLELGSDSAQLLDIIDQLIDAISLLTVLGALPGVPTSVPINLATFTSLKATLATIKGSL